jgi:hypothetical protein
VNFEYALRQKDYDLQRVKHILKEKEEELKQITSKFSIETEQI